MKAFEFIAVQTIAEACGVLAEYGAEACVLAGGTDLLIEWRRASKQVPTAVLDISRVTELGGITESDGSITLRPLATHSRLMHSEVLRKFAPLLGAAAAAIGSPQIRARGTVGGNIMNAAACADTVPPLVALGATVTLQSKAGARELELADLFVKPYQTKAKPDELLTGIRFPALSPGAGGAFIKLGRRNALSISRLSVAAILEVGKDGRIAEARIVPGAAFPTWKRVVEAEQMLLGEKPGPRLFAAAGQKVSAEMIKATGRRWSTEYKEPVLAVLVRRALEECASCREEGGLRAALKSVRAIPNPRPEDRRPKSELIATPAEQPPIEPGHSRNSEFGLLSGFGLRSSDFRAAEPDLPSTGRTLEQPWRGLEGEGRGGGARAPLPPDHAPLAARPATEVVITTTINGRVQTLAVTAQRTLLELLRDQLGFTGTKCGCEIGECGACTVLLDGEPVNACLVLAAQIDGREVLTVEGLAPDGKLHPLQESFLDHDAVHCGFCTPGMLLSAKALLEWNPRPTEADIRTAISGNLCRCTGYQQIVQAIAKVDYEHTQNRAR